MIATLEFQKIMLKFEYAAEIIDHELKTNGESTKLLLLLFDAEKFSQNIQQKIQRNSCDKKQSAVVRSQNAASHKCTLHIKPTDYHLSIVREILTKTSTDSNMKIDNQAINQSWCEYIVDFIVLILQDIFMLKIEENNIMEASTSTAKNTDNENELNTSDRFTKMFVVSGSRDVFLGRKQSKKITIHTLNAEMIDSQERHKNTAWEITLNVHVKIIPVNYDDIKIEFHDLIKTKKSNSFKTFFTNFDQNLNHLLKIFFVHKCGSFNKTIE